MSNTDTVKLLKECNSGCKTALDGMYQVRAHISSPQLKSTIEESCSRHEEIGNRCHKLLNEAGKSECDPPAIGTAMMSVGTGFKLAVNDSDKHIAEMMVDGCNMGIKSIAKQVNLYTNASPESRKLADDIISEEQHFLNQMLTFL